MVTSDADFRVRGAQIDWRASSPELGLGQDIDTVNQGLDGIPNFRFDFSTLTLGPNMHLGTNPATGFGAFLPTTGLYNHYTNLQQGHSLVDFAAATIWPESSEGAPFSMIDVQAGVPFRLGGMPVTLPSGRAPATSRLTC